MEPPKQLTLAIENAEGFRSHAYWDPIGKVWTVGFGQTGPNIGLNTVVTRQEATQWVIQNEQRIYNQLLAALPWAAYLSEVRLGALIDAAYNLGVAGLLEFSEALSVMKVKDWVGAVQGFRQSLWYQQVPNRVNTVCYMVLFDEWAEEYLTPKQTQRLNAAL